MLRSRWRTPSILLSGLVATARLSASAQAPEPPRADSTGSIAASVPATTAQPQLHSLTLRIDNDALNLGIPARFRPDEDYTSGVRIVYDGAWTPWWSGIARSWLVEPPCGDATPECSTSKAWIGQDMYTPERQPNSEAIVTDDPRPNAGWLYYAEELRRLTPNGAELLGLTFGVTGPPSFAAQTQKLAHWIADYDVPIDWSHQLAFEPGVIARYERDLLWTPVSIGPSALQIVPGVAGTAGNISTEATATMRARAGFNLGNPWAIAPPPDAAVQLALTVAWTEHAVARDLFLDGNTFRSGPRVGHLPFYLEREEGGSITLHRITLDYSSDWDGQMYSSGRPHRWSTVTGGYELCGSRVRATSDLPLSSWVDLPTMPPVTLTDDGSMDVHTLRPTILRTDPALFTMAGLSILRGRARGGGHRRSPSSGRRQ